jgi:hypothetical protein
MNETIPLSHLELDLPAPAGVGWSAYLADRGIAVVLDDVGRLAIARADAKRLFSERAEGAARAREVAERHERQAVEADRQWRAALPKRPYQLLATFVT